MLKNASLCKINKTKTQNHFNDFKTLKVQNSLKKNNVLGKHRKELLF